MRFFISTASNPFFLNIDRIIPDSNRVASIRGLVGGLQATEDSSYALGCGWSESYRLVLSPAWLPGVYTVQFPTSQGIRYALFVVRVTSPGSASRVAVSLPSHTWQAYNAFGGKSLYDYNSSESQRAYKVSYLRPYDDGSGLAQYPRWASIFLRWLVSRQLGFDVYMDRDLESRPNLLSYYDVLVLVGHDEYWSRRERQAVEDFLRRGGALVSLSGNTCWWQVRMDDDGTTMLCYKTASLDPLLGVNDSLVTTYWWNAPVFWPENTFLGASSRSGGFVNHSAILPRSQGYGDYAVFNTPHWVFEGTGLKEGDEIGWTAGIAGYEVDGATYQWQEGLPIVDGGYGTPRNYTILGVTPASDGTGHITGHGTMGIMTFSGGGRVFNAASTNWVNGLFADSIVKRITQNVLDAFISRRYPPHIIQWTPRAVMLDSINHELVPISRRTLAIPRATCADFRVSIDQTYPRPYSVVWSVDGRQVATADAFHFCMPADELQGAMKSISASVAGPDGTVSLTWAAYAQPLKIISEPRQNVYRPGEEFYYRPAVSSVRDTVVTYELIEAPDWLKMDHEGTMSGRVLGEGGLQRIRFQALNRAGDSDQQTLDVTVVSPGQSADLVIFPGFPSPSRDMTTLRVFVRRPAVVTMRMYDILGRKLAEPLNQIPLAAGYHDLTVASKTQGGYVLPSGTYYCQITAIFDRERTNSLVTKIVFVH